METAVLNLSFAMVVRMQGKGGDISHFWFHSEDSAHPPDSDSTRAFILNVDGQGLPGLVTTTIRYASD